MEVAVGVGVAVSVAVGVAVVVGVVVLIGSKESVSEVMGVNPGKIAED